MAFADDYVDVAERIRLFREAHPDGSLQPADPSQPFQIVTVDDLTFVAYTAAAYRTADDVRPGIGVAWERVPGLTNFTKNSELQNAETSAWGRAIVAVGAADTKKGIATRQDVEHRAAEADPAQHVKPSSKRECVMCGGDLAGSSAIKAPGGFAHDPPCEPKEAA